MARVALVAASVALAALAAPRPATAGQLARRGGLYLVTSSPAAATPGSLPLAASHFDLAVRGPLVTGTVTQTFRNDADRVVEATYVFPLPADAAVSAMAIDVGTRHIHAQIARRAEAAQHYEDAVAAGVGAGLV